MMITLSSPVPPNGKSISRRKRVKSQEAEVTNSTDCAVYEVETPSSGDACPPMLRQAPWRILIRDLHFVMSHLYLLPLVLFPLTSVKDVTAQAAVYQVFATVTSIALTVLCFLALFGLVPPILVIALVWLSFTLLVRSQGNQTRLIRGNGGYAPGYEKEEWFAVNGICITGGSAVIAGIRLNELFKRPITCILNRSLGVWFDILECVLQRDLLLVSEDIRIGYAHIRRALADPSKKRVVIIAHSQGGIIASAWADQFLNDFSPEVLKKLEFYTFASAANHFSRPTAKHFGRVEHFANESDFVARLGVLGVSPPPDRPDLCLTSSPEETCTCRQEDGIDSPIDMKIVNSIAAGLVDAGDAHLRGYSQDDQKPPLHPKGPSGPIEPSHNCRHRDREIPRQFGRFAGRIFMRPKHGGHLLCGHYLNPAHNILEDPVVKKHSKLVTYLNGGNSVE